MHHRFTKVVAVAATVSILFTGCASDGTMTQTGQGAAIGAITGNAGQGAGIGAVTGGAESARISDRERANVVRNCLRGRGYRVLN